MAKGVASVLLVAGLLVGLGGLGSGCYTTQRDYGYDYEYYPASEVYYAPSAGVYYWYADNRWWSNRHLPRHYVLSRPVRVHINDRYPYRHHDEVRSRYPRDYRGGDWDRDRDGRWDRDHHHR